jgi:drug/metabolite transporter (DMT)-like permease
MLAIITFIWGYSWVVAKHALAYAPPFALAAQRALLAALALLVIAKLMGKSLKLTVPREAIFIGLFQIAGFVGFSNWALVEGGAGKTSVLVFTMPIWTLLIAWPVLGERVRGQQWIAALCALGGMTLIIEPWNLHTSLFSNALAVGAALCWAIGTVLVKRLRARQPVDLLALTAWQMLLGSLPLALIAFVAPEPPVQWNLNYVSLLALLALVATALGWWIWLDILDRLPAWEASLSVLGTPVVAVIASRWSTGEEFSGIEFVGMVLIGGGLALLSLWGWVASRRAG